MLSGPMSVKAERKTLVKLRADVLSTAKHQLLHNYARVKILCTCVQ